MMAQQIAQRSFEDARREATETTKSDDSLDSKVRDLLTLGKQFLGVENGHFTQIDKDRNFWEARESTDPPDGEFPPGLRLELDTTFCRRTIEAPEPIALNDAGEQGWADDIAYQIHGIETYLGVSLRTPEDTEGTICFVSEDSRSRPFSQEELRFVEFLGSQISQLLHEHRHQRELQDRERLIKLTNRILRHNLRNDLTLVAGYAEMLREDADPEDARMAANITREVDQILSSADKIRTLDSQLSKTFDRTDRDLNTILTSTVESIEDTFPEASVTIEHVPDIPIQLSSRLEIVLFEFLENAAKYAGESPEIEVYSAHFEGSVEIDVIDNGPGMHDQELIAIRNEHESPLNHGSGVGLTLAAMIVADHDGTLNIDSSERGTHVGIEVPLDVTQLSA